MSVRARLVQEALERTLHEPVSPLELGALARGGINATCVISVGRRRFFVKWNDHVLPRQFEVEAKGLEALAASCPLVVPRPLAFNDAGPEQSFLVIEHLERGVAARDFDEQLGRGLAELHGASSARGFGFELDGYCGATPQPNAWRERWTDFYAEQRLGHQVRLAREDGMSSSEVAALERALARVPRLLADDEPPALLHGDLWSGNLLVAPDGRPALIDPAPYYGHREAELGMMLLFGGFGPRVFAAYEEVRPLREGWRERVDLYSLYHVLNHHHLFGGGYRAQALDLARRYT